MKPANIYTQSAQNLYTRNEQPSSFDYNDGDDCETYILACIHQSADLSTSSAELALYIRDWPTRYHLSAQRADLLRPFRQHLAGKHVLEIGSGCGAITRFLGESDAIVTALEGSERRAQITAARCRDMDKVTVVCDNFSQFESPEKFDIITLIGVLEYSNLFIPGEKPDEAVLNKVASLLNPGGVVLIAIENKLGLKYLAGAPEDHTATPYYGIENRYGSGTAITYGKPELEALLQTSGFSNAAFYYPFPDYKFPSVILGEKCFNTPGFNIENLVLPAIDYVQNKPYYPAFALNRAVKEFIHNNLTEALSNSFLVMAGTSAMAFRDKDTLAYAFSSERKAAYRKQNTFTIDANNNITVKRNRLYPEAPVAACSPVVKHITNEAYKKGQLHYLALTDIASTPGWCINDIINWATPYYQLLAGLSEWKDGRQYLPGKYVDITPSNILVHGHEWQFFDQEWEVNEPVPLQFVLFRGLYYSLAKPMYWHPPAEATPLHAFQLIQQVMDHFSALPAEIVDDFITREQRYFGNVGLRENYRPADFRLHVLPDAVMEGRGHQREPSFQPLTTLTTKLFFRTPETDFSEQGAVSGHFQLEKQPQTYTLRINDQPCPIQAIRIDPAEETGALKLYSITIKDDAGNTLLYWNMNATTVPAFHNLLAIPAQDHYLLVLLSDDPMILVGLPQTGGYSHCQWLDVQVEMAMIAGTGKSTEAMLSTMACIQQAGGPVLPEEVLSPADETLTTFRSWFSKPFLEVMNEQETSIASLQAQLKVAETQYQQMAAGHETLKKHLDWFHHTYEKRSLAGIIKTRSHQWVAGLWLSLLNKLLATGFIRRKYVATYLLEYARENGLRRSMSSLFKTADEHGLKTISRARALTMAAIKARNAPLINTDPAVAVQDYDPELLKRTMKQWERQPLISIIVPTYNTKPELLEKAIASVRNQLYEHWELCIGDDCSSSANTNKQLLALMRDKKIKVKFHEAHAGISGVSNRAIEMANGEYIALLDHDDELAPDALYEVVRELNEHPEADIVYTDECKIDEDGRLSDPFLKPDWSPELLLNMMYVGHLTVYRKDFLEQKVGYFRTAYDFSQDYDLMLRATQHTAYIRHIPKVLYYWRITAGSATVGDKPYARQSNLAALEDAMAGRDINAEIIELPVANRARLIIDRYPTVSLIVPTDSLKNLTDTINSIVQGTDYPDYEIVAVTNSPLISTLKEQVQAAQVTYVPYDRPYNFSDKCNVGAAQARGELIIFFNDDVRPLQQDWIQQTIEFLFMPGVSGVSPKLVYENNTIQYAGMVAGVRNLVGTSFHTYPNDSTAYINFPQLVRNVSILSGACLAMRKDLFLEIGGFDAVNTPSNHSDVDLSFRILEKGLRCVYTPYATLCHIGHLSLQEHEKKEKKTTKDRSDIFLLKRWINYLAADPYFTAPMRSLLYHDSPEPFRVYAPIDNKPAGTKGNVLAVSHDLSLSGAPIMLYNSCLLMQQEGYFVQVVSPTDGPVRNMYQQAGIPVITDTLVLRQHPSFYRFAKNFDYLICNTAITWPVVAQLQDIVKTGWWIHEAGVLESLAAMEPGLVTTLQQANNLLTPGRYAAGYIERYNDQVKTMYYGCEDFYHSPAASIENNKKIVVSIIGSIEYRKGQDIVIDALDHIPEHLLHNMELWIVGRTHDPAFKAMLDTKIAGRAHVRYTGETSHDGCIHYMQQSDVIISASRDDPFPVVLIEALCLAKTCILSSTTGTAELIDEGVNGFVFEQENSRQLADRIAKVLHNPGLLTAIGLQARITYEEHLTLEQFRQQWLHYLETLRAGSHHRIKTGKKQLIHEQ